MQNSISLAWGKYLDATKIFMLVLTGASVFFYFYYGSIKSIPPAVSAGSLLITNTDTVTLEQFGVKGDGSDETTKITAALQSAATNKSVLKLDSKTYIFSPVQTVDVTGIKGITGNGTFDLSNTGAAAGNKKMTAVFRIKGSKIILQSGITGITENAASIQLAKGLAINKGDVLFLTSSELISNSKRPYYCKGQRLTVKEYNSLTGVLIADQAMAHSITNACLWLNNKTPGFFVTNEVKFITSPMNFIACFQLQYCRASMSGYYKNFALAALMYQSSAGTVSEMHAELPVTSNNGYSYCIEVNDMSDVLVSNCTLSGGRHVITTGAGGLWEKEECGGTGHAGYGSTLVVDGGTYRGSDNVEGINPDIGTLDSHGIAENMTIKNCTIYGGINLGANHAQVSNVTIYTNAKNAFNIGSDVTQDADWGDYKIDNVKIFSSSKRPVFFSKAPVNNVDLSNITVEGLGADMPFVDFRNNGPKKVSMNKVNIQGAEKRKKLILSGSQSAFNIANSNLSKD